METDKDKIQEKEKIQDQAEKDQIAEKSSAFKLTPEDLLKMFDPKSLSSLHELGGLEGIAKELDVDLTSGLPVDFDHSKRIAHFGENRLPEQKQQNLFQLIWIALHDKTLIFLCFAAFISLAVGIYIDTSPNAKPNDPHWIEGCAIIVTVFIVVLVQSINDYQKESQFRALNAKKEDRQVKVQRGGSTHVVSIFDVVVGDIVNLEPGDVLNVDGILINGHNLKSDESSATGESDLIRKMPYSKDATDIDPFILSGGKVTEGVGQFLVTCVGVHSFNGKLMMGLRVPTEDTPLQVKLDNLAENIAKIGASISILLLIVLLLKYVIGKSIGGFPADGAVITQDIINIVIQAIVIIVVAVPEGLPLAVTIALAYGTRKMLKDNNLVRVLSACETMGNATAVCSDKTGTLTQNKMTVVNGFIGCKFEFKSEAGIQKLKGKLNIDAKNVMDTDYRPLTVNDITPLQYNHLLIDSVVANSSAFIGQDEKGKEVFVGNKTESALLDFCVKIGLTEHTSYKKSQESNIVQVYPFSSERKSMSTVLKYGDVVRVYTKGASEIVLKFSDYVTMYDDQKKTYNQVQMSDNLRQLVQTKISNYADESLRTIITAYRDIPLAEYQSIVGVSQLKDLTSEATEKLEAYVIKGLSVLALVGIEDPLREGVSEAVKKCQNAGVNVRMVTGDNVQTAKAIATKCGIYYKGGVVMEGPQFRKLNDDELEAVLPRLQVLARSSPGDKQILVGKLKDMGETVAVTGDGTNDAPALKMADVGFSMGITGTEVAKEASSIVLMDDNFSSIVKAMMWGRSVNDSVKKFLQFQLTVNVSAVHIAFISACADNNNESVLTAVQLLWVNLIMDSLAALTLATDPPSEEILNRLPDSKKDPLITVDMWKMILGQAYFQIIVVMVLYFAGPTIFFLDTVNSAYDKQLLRTLIFNTFIFLQLFNQLNCRQMDRNVNIIQNLRNNNFFIPITILIIVVQIIIINFGGIVFSTVPIDGSKWAVSVLVPVLVLPIGFVVRLLPTGNGCTICGVDIGKRDLSRVRMTKERMQWQNAIGSVKNQLNVFRALRGTARHSLNSNGSIESDSNSAHSGYSSPASSKKPILMQTVVPQERISSIAEESQNSQAVQSIEILQ